MDFGQKRDVRINYPRTENLGSEMLKNKRNHLIKIPTREIASGLIALLGVGMLIGQSFQPEPTKSTNQIKIEKNGQTQITIEKLNLRYNPANC